LHKAVNDIKYAVFEEGKHEYLNKIPAQNILPAFGLYYAAFVSESVQFSEKYLDYGISPNVGPIRKKAID
jgi:hypothetical protein